MRYAAPSKETKRLEEAMSTVYRKSGSREFYKVEQRIGIVTRVLNKKYFSRVDISYNKLVMEANKASPVSNLLRDGLEIDITTALIQPSHS